MMNFPTSTILLKLYKTIVIVNAIMNEYIISKLYKQYNINILNNITSSDHSSFLKEGFTPNQ
jgi:hypothetical protein